nr:hypothetical protein [Tanacetum cinerariifolium]
MGLGPPPAQYLVHQSLATSRRHVAASYWTTTVNVGQRRSTPSATVGQRRSTPPATVGHAAGHRSTAADHGGDRRSTVTVNDGCRWRTIVDCRWTTVDHHRSTVVGGLVNKRVWAGLDRVSIGSGPGPGRVWIGSGSGPPRGMPRHISKCPWLKEFFEGAFGGVGDEEVVIGEGVVVVSSSFVKLTKSCLGGMMVSLIFLKALEEEAWVEAMEEKTEEDKYDRESGEDGYLIKEIWIIRVKHDV